MIPTTRTWPMMCVTLVCCGHLVGNTYSYTVASSIDLLQWAPLRLKVKPYLTFLNQYYQPTWRTRHPMTMEREALRHLRLPRGEPFALACGACFQRSSTEANLTMEVSSGQDYYYRPKMRRRGEIQKYNVNRLTCLLSYLQTAPLNTSGRITCSLNRGRHTHSDTITFSLVDVVVDEVDVVDKVIPYTGDMSTELHCASPKEALVSSPTNPLVYVWYQDPNPGNVLIPKLEPVISLPTPRYTRHVTCSAYNIGRPSTIHRTHYTITGSHITTTASQQQQQNQQQYEDDDLNNNHKIPTTIIGIVTAAVIVAVLIIFMGIYHFCTAASTK